MLAPTRCVWSLRARPAQPTCVRLHGSPSSLRGTAPGRPRGGRPFFATAGRPCGGRAALGRGAALGRSGVVALAAPPGPAHRPPKTGALRPSLRVSLRSGSRVAPRVARLCCPGPASGLWGSGGAGGCVGGGFSPAPLRPVASVRAGVPRGPALQPRSPTAAPQPPPGPARTTRGIPAAHRKRAQRVPTEPPVVGTACTNTTRGGESAPPEAAAPSGLLPCFPPRPCRPRWGLPGSARPPAWGLPPPSRLRRASPWCPAASAQSGLDFPRCLCYSVRARPVPLLRGLPSGYPWTASKPLDRKAGRFFYALLAALLPTENHRSAAQDVNRKTRPPPRRIAPSEQTPKSKPTPGPKLRERGKPPLQAKQKTKLDTKTSGRRLHRLPRPTQQNLCYFVAFTGSQEKAAVVPR